MFNSGKLRADVAEILLRFAEPAAAGRAADEICEHARQYLDQREQQRQIALPTSAGQRFRRWHKAALPRLRDIEGWLSRWDHDSSVKPSGTGNLLEQLRLQQECALREIREFREWLEFVYQPPMKGDGPPVDWVRADLEEMVGQSVWHAGVRPTSTKGGTYWHVVTKVHVAVGLSGTDGAVCKAIQVAVARHREWKQSPQLSPK